MKEKLPPGSGQSNTPAVASFSRGRRAVLAAASLAVAALALDPAAALARQPAQASHWVGTWGTAPATPHPSSVQAFDDQTLRLLVHASVGGKRARIRVSNELGTTPLHIGAAHIALSKGGAAIVDGSDRALAFSGMQGITVPPGAAVLSDPVALAVPAQGDLAVSLQLSGKAQAQTVHGYSLQTSYVSKPGNFTAATDFPIDHTIGSWPFLTEVDVDAPGSAAIVALGDSITDGSVTRQDANHRWTDLLAQRLQSAGSAKDAAGGGVGIVNRGISGNRMLRDPGEQPLFGKAAIARFDRDVLATAGVRYLIVLIGINDIGHPGTGSIPASEEPSAADLIAGYRQIIARAHEKGIAVYGATLTPFEHTTFRDYYTAEKEAIRLAVNKWIRASGEFDGVIDFERAVRDPHHPTRMLPAYDSGDHLHPNDKGMQAMADAIPLAWFAHAGSGHDAAPAKRSK